MLHLEDLVLSARYATALEYCEAVELELGVSIGERRMQQILDGELKAKIVQAQTVTPDKYNDESLVRLCEFVSETINLDRIRLRFYDQTSFSRKELVYKKRRKLPGAPTPQIRVPMSQGNSYSVFGLTSIQPDRPPLYCNVFRCDGENTQDSVSHYQFFMSALSDGIISAGDIVVADNWSAHHSPIGNHVKDILGSHGIFMIFVPPKHSELNPIEHLWRSLKARARMLLRRFYYKDVPGAPWLLQAALDTISHRDVAACMEHDGYLIEEKTWSLL
eukprot:scaffold533_cov226-Pinguiococcus_pyrenoidosus.AAC.4